MIPTNPFRFARVRTALRASLCAATFLVASCQDQFLPGVPTGLSVTESEFTFTAIGQNHQLIAKVVDGHGGTLDEPVIWSTSDQTIVRVNGAGLATAIAPGTATVTVSTDGMTESVDVTVAQKAAHIRAIRGNGQGGAPAAPLPSPLIVEVTDALNHRVPGIDVSFTAGPEGGSPTPATATTDWQGRASTSFTLGPDSITYSMIATVTGTTLADTFHVKVGPSYTIELMFLNGATPSQEQAFADAKARWESIITGDVPDDYALIPANSCGDGSPALDRPIDDVLIMVNLTDIDGPGGILGYAAPCFVHEVGFLPAIGTMTFDVADLDTVEAYGLLPTVITHEMGHVLGFGTMWTNFGLLADGVLTGGTDPHFIGPQTLAAFDAAGGLSYLGGKVPVEDLGGPGTADGHWRESVFDNELMTGWVNLGTNPLSAVTITSLADLGYQVDTTQADAFALPVAGPSAESVAGRRFDLSNDVRHGPIGTIGKRGRPNGVYRR